MRKAVVKSLSVLFLMASPIGCASAFVQHIGTNRYQIDSVGGIVSSADDAFTDKAQELCPRGYKVIERDRNRGAGTIECE